MKKLLFTIPALCLFLASCGGGDDCDVSTAEGTAECYCSLMEQYEVAVDAEDDAAVETLSEKLDKFKADAEKHMESGDYSENDVEKIINETCEAH